MVIRDNLAAHLVVPSTAGSVQDQVEALKLADPLSYTEIHSEILKPLHWQSPSIDNGYRGCGPCLDSNFEGKTRVRWVQRF